MFVSTILNIMEVLNAELQLQTGEADQAKGLIALNVAQDYFESLAAQRGKIFGSSIGTVATASGVESTVWPSTLLRLDRLQYLNGSVPAWDVVPTRRAGGHAVTSYWPLNLILTPGTGAPTRYWADGTNIYWSPKPDGIYTVRWYGFASAADLTASNQLTYPDIVALPLATFANRLIKSGLDDNVQDLSALAQEVFAQALDALAGFNRDGATGLEYTQIHNT